MKNKADHIAELIIQHYSQLPSNGKPCNGQFTVISGIVAYIDHYGYFIIAITSGTKCLSNSSKSYEPGAILSDSHAEVLSRRCLIRYILLCALYLQKDESFQLNPYCPLEKHIDSSNPKGFKLVMKSSWSLWLYVSDSPCGEASVYKRTGLCRSFTGEKSRRTATSVSQEDGDSHKVDDSLDNAYVNMLRLKPGRRDMDDSVRSSSMSCTDKITRWCCLGLQGCLIPRVLENPITLAGIVIGNDPGAEEGAQLEALRRALVDRIEHSFRSSCALCPCIPELFIASSDVVFEYGKCAVEVALLTEAQDKSDADRTIEKKRKRGSQGAATPCATSINWIADVPFNVDSKHIDSSNRQRRVLGGTVEVTLAATGRPQGAAKASISKNAELGKSNLESRLCRRAIASLYLDLLECMGESYCGSCSYRDCKQEVVTYRHKRETFLSATPFAGWISDDPAYTECFPVKKVTDLRLARS